MIDRSKNRATPTRKDFQSNQEVRWCPACGDYSILSQVQKIVPTLGIEKEKFVFVSGIGCSSRFPYYMNTYGFHTIHGRAPTIATGLKVANPDLSVWVITGDGDALSIGGNHLIHALRRNMDIKILLFNNRIYGLTKGQYSPTSEQGKKTKSTPAGSPDYPVHPVSLALAAEATFVARAIDTDTKHLAGVIERAARHRGSAFIEIFQNCNIFNDGAFDEFKARDVRDERVVRLEQGKPVRFGKEGGRGIRLRNCTLEAVSSGPGEEPPDCIVHDEKSRSFIAYMLARMEYPEFPVAIGVFRDLEKPTYGELLDEQGDFRIAGDTAEALRSLLHTGETWVVGNE